jgi:predicted dehydrogenase
MRILYATGQPQATWKKAPHIVRCRLVWVLPNSMPLIYDLKVEIIGTEGALYLDTNDQMLRKGTGSAYSHVHTMGTRINGLSTGGANFMVHYFVDVLRKHETPEANEKAGLINTRIVEAIHRSLESGLVEQLRAEPPYPGALV